MTGSPSPLIHGREEFISAMRDILSGLPGSATRTVWCLDKDFALWPFDEPAVIDALTRWVKLPDRHIRIVGVEFESISRAHPRFTAFRQTWAHRVDARRPLEAERGDLPSILLAGNEAIELLDDVHWRARRVSTRAELRQLDERCEAIAQRCEPAWPATTLGL